MAKTYSMQVEKARILLDGLRKNQSRLTSYGVTDEVLAQLERNAVETERMDVELDALRLQVSGKASAASRQLDELRKQIQALKQIVKKNFDPNQWEGLGVPDKR